MNRKMSRWYAVSFVTYICIQQKSTERRVVNSKNVDLSTANIGAFNPDQTTRFTVSNTQIGAI